MELYKYTGSVADLTVRFGKAETITLYDSSADSAARELKSRCEKMGRRVFCWGYESVAEAR